MSVNGGGRATGSDGGTAVTRERSVVEGGDVLVLRVGDWETMREAAAPIRTEVFVNEQGIAPELEWDPQDATCLHCVAYEGERAVATGRLLPDGHIGRMAVLASRRGGGVGGAVLQRLMQAARERGHREAILHAQCSVERFYRRHGFVAEGEPYEEAGIRHITMRRSLIP